MEEINQIDTKKEKNRWRLKKYTESNKRSLKT
jgi:hypothetical protein